MPAGRLRRCGATLSKLSTADLIAFRRWIDGITERFAKPLLMVKNHPLWPPNLMGHLSF
jgi:hypothetical protein